MTKATRLGAIGLLVAGGAAAVGASTSIDVTGNNRVLSGSDTLKLVVQQVLTNTPAAAPGSGAAPTESTNGTYFVGGGQSVSDSAIDKNTQQISVGTASLKNTIYVGVSIDSDGNGSLDLPIQGTTEALLLGLDGLSILGNDTASGVPASPSGVTGTLGLAVANKSFAVHSHNADGSENTTIPPTFPGSATGANANYGAVSDGAGHWTYTLQSSIDALRLIYGGLHHNGTGGIGDFNANSDVRRSLANQWEAIFNTNTAVSGTNQLNHAYRRSDLAGTTNAFIALVGFGTRKLGTLTGNVSGTNKTTSPFANDAAAAGLTVGNATGAIVLTNANNTTINNDPTATDTSASALFTYLALARNDVNSVVVNNAGSGDQLDLDPIRRTAARTGLRSLDFVASPGSAPSAGTLGLVQTVFYPDTPNIALSQTYPTVAADPGAFDFLPAGNAGKDSAPVGASFASNLLQPYWLSDGSPVTGGNVTTNHQQLDSTGLHYVTVTVTNAKGVRSPDVDIAVLNDGTTNVQLATPPVLFYAHHYNNVSRLNNLPVTAFANDDGRAYNGPVRDDLSGAYVKDNNNRELASGWYKVRSLSQSTATSPAFYTYAPNLQQTNSDFQTGALIAADPKSIGFTGRGVDVSPLTTAFNSSIQALWLSGSSASGFDPTLSTPPSDQNVLNLLVNPNGAVQPSVPTLNTTATAAVYPLARRTYLATLVGFSENPKWSVAQGGSGTFNPAAVASDGGPAVRGLQGEEYALAAAFGDSDHVGAAFLANGFIPLPATSAYVGSASPPAVNGVYALDYPELNSTAPTASYLATGTGATPGGTNRDATIASPPVLKPYGTSSAAAGAPPTSPYPFHSPWPDPAFPAY